MTTFWQVFWIVFSIVLAHRIGYAQGRAHGWRQAVEALKKKERQSAYGVDV